MKTEHYLGLHDFMVSTPQGVFETGRKRIYAAFYPFGDSTAAVIRVGGRRYGLQLVKVNYQRLRSHSYKAKLAFALGIAIEHGNATALGAKR